ncbi:hypothetical protein LCGC14_2433780 [marine sediment metagenome]|uniref:Uncharacterized protein n=1 Tax=marine sediment metagenome TaxID=412755 RepID=A0A0F9EF27_9ZZZZ
MSEKEKQELLEQINKLTPVEFSKLCLKIVKKIVNRNPIKETIKNHIEKPDIKVLVKLIIDNDIKIDEKEEK